MTIFFYGSNTYELRLSLREMIATYEKKTGSDVGLERVDGSAVSLRELTGALQASPFLVSSRLVIVEGLSSNKTVGPKLAGLLETVPKTTVAVFVDAQVDQRTVAFKALSKADKVVKFEMLTGPKLQAWVRREVELLGGVADAAALRELVALCGEDQWRLAGEINKLVNYEPTISVETVRAMVVPSVEQSIFELVETMTAGHGDKALVGYRRLIEQRESELYILTMIQWQLRNLLLAKTAPPAMSPAELAKAAGMSPYVAGKMAVAQSNIGEPALREAFKAAVECEYLIKTGRRKAGIAVEQLIYRIGKLCAPS